LRELVEGKRRWGLGGQKIEVREKCGNGEESDEVEHSDFNRQLRGRFYCEDSRETCEVLLSMTQHFLASFSDLLPNTDTS